MQNEEGFTLLEMLLVMVVITILLLLIIPNVVTQRSSIQGKGCAILREIYRSANTSISITT